MLMKALVGCTFILLSLPAVASAQLPPPEQSLPAGFRISNSIANGMQVGYEATKGQSWPKCFDALPAQVRLGWTWQGMPGAGQYISLIVKAPEEPMSRMGLTVTEPAGKEMLLGGALTWRKTTVPCVGYGEKPPLVTYDAKWIGAWKDGMLAVGVNNAVGSKAEIKPWIEQVLAPFLGRGAPPVRASPGRSSAPAGTSRAPARRTPGK